MGHRTTALNHQLQVTTLIFDLSRAIVKLFPSSLLRKIDCLTVTLNLLHRGPQHVHKNPFLVGSASFSGLPTKATTTNLKQNFVKLCNTQDVQREFTKKVSDLSRGTQLLNPIRSFFFDAIWSLCLIVSNQRRPKTHSQPMWFAPYGIGNKLRFFLPFIKPCFLSSPALPDLVGQFRLTFWLTAALPRKWGRG